MGLGCIKWIFSKSPKLWQSIFQFFIEKIQKTYSLKYGCQTADTPTLRLHKKTTHQKCTPCVQTEKVTTSKARRSEARDTREILYYFIKAKPHKTCLWRRWNFQTLLKANFRLGTWHWNFHSGTLPDPFLWSFFFNLVMLLPGRML